MRIISLTCSNTEIVCALGGADWLVAVDDHSDHPAEVVERLPRVGPDLGIDVDRVAALEPDLVLASLTVPGHERVVERIESRGLPHLAPETETLEDVYEDIRVIADRLGVEARGEELVRSMRAEIPAPAGGTAPAAPRVLVEWWPKPVIVPGRRSWVTDLLHAAGGRNPFGDRDAKSLSVEPPEVTEGGVDAAVISWCGVSPERYLPRKVYEREGWSGLRAVREGRVHCVPEAFLGRPGPRLVDGFRALRGIVESCNGARH